MTPVQLRLSGSAACDVVRTHSKIMMNSQRVPEKYNKKIKRIQKVKCFVQHCKQVKSGFLRPDSGMMLVYVPPNYNMAIHSDFSTQFYTPT